MILMFSLQTALCMLAENLHQEISTLEWITLYNAPTMYLRLVRSTITLTLIVVKIVEICTESFENRSISLIDGTGW